MRRGAAIATLAGCLAAGALAGDGSDKAISGTIAIAEGASVSAGDRLVIKMYHPDEDLEKDLKFWILEEYSFPQAFAVAPTASMAGQIRWDDYVIEVFTDRDRDVLSVVEGELRASTGVALPLGTAGVSLIMEPVTGE